MAGARRYDGCPGARPDRSPDMSSLRPVLLLLVALVAASCGRSRSHVHVRDESPRLVSILVEVYDPVTDFVWEGVSVRIVEAYQEWSDTTWVSPYVDWYETDATGRVLLDEFDLAFAEVGFLEDVDGRALLGARRDEDQAFVVLEVDALGFTPVTVEVPLSWDVPDVFVEVPFE